MNNDEFEGKDPNIGCKKNYLNYEKLFIKFENMGVVTYKQKQYPINNI
jgi:hypothetical protein